ncbi:MAG: Uma2 family endonuclease [Chloroflexota bacterium]|nr:Uma2 family endonuclease [Chloroflexota bacterium]
MITRAIALGPEFDTLPDDTEETLVGTSLHQGAITALYTSLALCGPRRGLPWFVGNQLKIVIPRQGNRAPYMPYPDILVHPTLTSASRSSLVLAVDGPPALVIEVASPATAVEQDVNLTSPTGKPRVYETIGVSEYLVFDPAGDILGSQVWARRASPGGYVPWEPEADGRWVSTALRIAFQPQGVLLRVYDQDGNLVPLTEELANLVEERDRQLAAQARRLAALEAELRKLRGA